MTFMSDSELRELIDACDDWIILCSDDADFSGNTFHSGTYVFLN